MISDEAAVNVEVLTSRRTLFTPETARFFAARAAEARRIKREADQKRLASVDLLAEALATQRVEPQSPVADPQPGYAQNRLVRVRAMLDTLDEKLERQLDRLRIDPGEIDKLASASSRLEEQERRLSGRFTPGQIKPPTGRAARKSSGDIQPLVSPPE